MAQATPKIRLFVEAPLRDGAEIALDRDQSHYLTGVMRRGVGQSVALFNGTDGEWAAEITQAAKRGVQLACTDRLRAQDMPPDVWLCFAPIKKARTDFIAEKACEMGCRRMVPVFTQYTNSERVRIDRLRAHAVEAAEQCGLLSVPVVAEPVTLSRMLDDWPDDRRLMFCDERGRADSAVRALADAGPGPWAVLTGPEGGFAPEEAARLERMPQAVPVSLGPRVLRADTAAVAALAVWQSVLGDWT